MRPLTQSRNRSTTRSSKAKSSGGRPGPGPTFVSKLYKLLSDEGNARLITWTPAGDAFVVLRPSEFAHQLLPTQYKHSQFQSFVRQANMYGFSKITLPSAMLSQLLAFGESSTSAPTRSRTSLPVGLVRTSAPLTDASPMPLPTRDPMCAPDVPHTEAAAAGPAVGTRGAKAVSALDEQPWAFKHPKFMRGAVDLLPEVRRKSRVRKPSLTGLTASGEPPGGIEVGVGGNGSSLGRQDLDIPSAAMSGDFGEDDEEGLSSGRGGLYGEGDPMESKLPSMSMSAGWYHDTQHGSSQPLADSGYVGLAHGDDDFGTVIHQSASPLPHVDANPNLHLPARPPSYPAPARHTATSYPAHGAAAPPLPSRYVPTSDQYAGQSATSAAMFRLAELTSKLADMVTRSLPQGEVDDVTSATVRSEVTCIVSEAWGIANAFTGGDVCAGSAESATGSSADSLPHAARHYPLASGYASWKLYGPGPRTHPGFSPAGHNYGGGGGVPYSRAPSYIPSARDMYLSPPYTSHSSFPSRSPADMYWPDPTHLPHSPSHPPAYFSASSPAGVVRYAHHFPPPHAMATSGRYHSHSSSSAAAAAAGGPRYFSSAAMDEHVERSEDGERRQAQVEDEYDLAMTRQWH